MIEFLYQAAINIFAFLIKFVAPFSLKIKLGVEGRKGLLERMEKALPNLIGNKPVAWFHAASLGEFEQGRPVIESYRKQYPDHYIVLTFFSPSGYEIRKDYSGADFICYLPIDTAANARRFVQILQPRIVFFIKYEFWFNYLKELKKSGCHILSFSAIFWREQSFFKPYGGFSQKMLAQYDHIFVQNEESVLLLNQIGISACSIAGDTRFDRVKSIADQARDVPEVEQFQNTKPCLIAGSVWEADMQVLIPVLNHLKGRLKTVIAPHEIKKEQIELWRNQIEGKTALFSEVKAGAAPEQFDCLIIDNIGMLSSLYRYGNMAFIGGAFGAGLHNILEAATFGLPVIFGDKSYERFQEALDLIEKGGATAVPGTNAMIEVVEMWLQDPAKRLAAGEVSRNYVLSRTGATQTVMNMVKEMLG